MWIWTPSQFQKAINGVCGCCAGGWFSVMMSGIYTGIMLLWFWGQSKKKNFYSRKTLKLHQFLALMADDGKDEQTSMTIAAQKIALKSSATKLKRVRGTSFPVLLSRNWSSGPVYSKHSMIIGECLLGIPDGFTL